MATAPTGYGVQGGNSVSQNDLPAWYQAYSKNLGRQAMNIAQANNSQPLPFQSVAGFNDDQASAFDSVRNNQGAWRAPVLQGAANANQIAPTAAKFADYAQGAVAGPAQTTASAVQPWAQGAQSAVAGNAQTWADPGTVAKYMSPYTSQVVDNIARLGARNWEDTIMPGVNSSMIGSGQFGSTRNADILTRAGVHASDDITGQQSNALQAGYAGASGIFANDANRVQNQQKYQSDAALGGGNLMQGALSGDANRVQNQQQIQSNAAIAGGNMSTNALHASANALGALGQQYQSQSNTDSQSMLNIGNQQQALQQGGLTTAYNNAMAARNDPWTQLNNASSILHGVQLPTNTTTSSSSQNGVPPDGITSAAAAALQAAGIISGKNYTNPPAATPTA